MLSPGVQPHAGPVQGGYGEEAAQVPGTGPPQPCDRASGRAGFYLFFTPNMARNNVFINRMIPCSGVVVASNCHRHP